MMPFQYLPPRPITMNELVTWRIQGKNNGFDLDSLKKYGQVIMEVDCEDGVIVFIILDKKK